MVGGGRATLFASGGGACATVFSAFNWRDEVVGVVRFNTFVTVVANNIYIRNLSVAEAFVQLFAHLFNLA